MAALVACLLTGMSHPVLPEKPVFCVKAPQRGSGKTTLVNMIVRPITRRSAVAASWSVNEEERRKAFFAVAREGHGILMIDNIPRGTVIRDATIERFATSAEVRDRVLGESRTEAVRSPVVVLTGNALQMGGDSGSRTLTIELTADRPDPENREFKHPDILGWCDRNRAQILKAALTILLGNPTLRNRDRKDRDTVQGLVRAGGLGRRARGQALAGMPARMVDLFAQSEGEDDTVSVLVELLGLLLQAFPGKEFTIEELTAKLNTQNVLDPEALNNQLLDAIHSVGRQPLRAVTAQDCRRGPAAQRQGRADQRCRRRGLVHRPEAKERAAGTKSSGASRTTPIRPPCRGGSEMPRGRRMRGGNLGNLGNLKRSPYAREEFYLGKRKINIVPAREGLESGSRGFPGSHPHFGRGSGVSCGCGAGHSAVSLTAASLSGRRSASPRPRCSDLIATTRPS